MNNKGQYAMGGLILLFIGVIVAFALLPSIADSTAIMTDTRTGANVSVTPVLNTAVAVGGQELIGTPTVVNTSNGLDLVGTNLTVTEGLCATDGGKSVCVTLGGDGTIDGGDYDGQPVNINYVFGADGYAPDAGARGIANIIVIFAALAILGYAVYYATRELGVLGK